MLPSGALSWAPIRPSGGEYACSVVAGGPSAWATRWMSELAKSKTSPGPKGRTRGARGSRRRSSRTRPSTTYRPRGQVVIVKARVMVVHPADQPHHHVLVVDEQLVGALVAVVADVRAPQLRSCGDVGDQLAEVHAATASRLANSSRAGLRRVIASHAASPSGPGGAKRATTGRSEPCTSWSTPTTRTIASISRRPYEEVS